MIRCASILLPGLLLVAGGGGAASLPDTGQDLCDNGSNVLVACSSTNAGNAATYPRQDGRFGRDPKAAAGALAKIGAGAAGFDYTKVANNGGDLAAGVGLGANPTDWACTRDNITGLVWEVKVNDATQLRHQGWTYTWYDSDGATNGGNAGRSAGGTCKTAGRCDTEKFVADVNAASLCGYNDWRMPTARELTTLVDAGAQSPAIDTIYFPNSNASSFWSGSSYVPSPANAWYVELNSGLILAGNKTFNGVFVRLVRGGQF